MATLFDFWKEPKKITKPIRLIELFAGIGSQAKALENLKADFEHYKICEFDKYAVKSYNEVHSTNFEPSDITKLTADDLGITETDKYEYIMTYSFPCQDLSLAGKMKGMAKGGNTRSGLLWEVERLLKECKELPQVLVMENVPQVHSQDNVDDFANWISFLDTLGYTNYWQDLNAKDYGVPQNRNRCFMVSLLGEWKFEFPGKTKLKLRLKDMLEPNVDKKYYLSIDIIKTFETHKDRNIKKGNGFGWKPLTKDDIAYALKTSNGEKANDNFIKLEQVGELSGGKWDNMHESSKRVYSANGLAPTLNTCGGGNLEPKISINNEILPITKDTENYIEWHKEGLLDNDCRAFKTDKISATLTTSGKEKIYDIDKCNIRKLTPKECWRLMGFDDADFEKASKVNSDCQLYKQAGNSIVVNVLVAIFSQMI